MQHFKKAHYELKAIQTLIQNSKTRIITEITRKNAFSALGLLTDDEIVEKVLLLKESDIYKTMTTNHDSKLWQDVYKTNIDGIDLYIKLQISYDKKGVIIQFKLSDE